MSETNYLVTGAAGFLASTICRQLAAEGKYDQRVVDANVGGTNTMIDMCLAHPECKMMVYCSSIGAVPESPKGTRIKEVTLFHPEKLRDCYSQTKAQASQNVLDAVKSRGLRACIVHPSGILGPEDWGMSDITKNLIAILHGELPAGIDGSFNLADVRDLANGTILAGEKGRIGECYILGNEVITFRQFCKTIADECGCKPVRFFMPIWMSYATAWCAELIGKITKKPPIMTTFNVYNLARNNEYDYSKAQKELGYTTRSCAQTMQEKILRINALGTVYVNQEFGKRMKAGSVIVDISSNSAYSLPGIIIPKKSYPLAETDEKAFLGKLIKRSNLAKDVYQKNGFAYALSKNFVCWYAAKSAFELGEKGIRVVSLSPGLIATGMGEAEQESISFVTAEAPAARRNSEIMTTGLAGGLLCGYKPLFPACP